MNRIFYGRVHNWKLILKDDDLYRDVISSLEGKDVSVSIGEAKPVRSNQANAYYWGVIINMISIETGGDPESLHEYFKRKFLIPKIRYIAGEEVSTYSTKHLDRQEFWDYVERVRAFAGEFLGMTIPSPDQVSI